MEVLGYDTAEEAENDLRLHIGRMTGGCKAVVIESRPVTAATKADARALKAAQLSREFVRVSGLNNPAKKQTY